MMRFSISNMITQKKLDISLKKEGSVNRKKQGNLPPSNILTIHITQYPRIISLKERHGCGYWDGYSSFLRQSWFSYGEKRIPGISR